MMNTVTDKVIEPGTKLRMKSKSGFRTPATHPILTVVRTYKAGATSMLELRQEDGRTIYTTKRAMEWYDRLE
jgi:hypothetical protein